MRVLHLFSLYFLYILVLLKDIINIDVKLKKYVDGKQKIIYILRRTTCGVLAEW